MSPAKSGRPSCLGVCVAIGRVTFLEILRDRILYTIVLVALLLFGVSLLASQLTFIGPNRVMLDIGLAAVTVAVSAIGIFLGSSALNREFERRTAYVALSRPITRAHFLCGKFSGVAAALSLNWFLLALTYLAVLVLGPGQELSAVGRLMTSTLGLALVFAWLQGLVLAALGMAISTYSTTTVSVLFGIGFYLIGVNVPELRLIAAKLDSPSLAWLLKSIASVIPDLATFALGTKVTYDLPVPASYALSALGYGAAWIALALGVGSLLIRTKES